MEGKGLQHGPDQSSYIKFHGAMLVLSLRRRGSTLLGEPWMNRWVDQSYPLPLLCLASNISRIRKTVKIAGASKTAFAFDDKEGGPLGLDNPGSWPGSL